MNLTVLQEIETDLEEVTEADLRRASRMLGPIADHEKVLGTVHSLDARRLWALGFLYGGKGAIALCHARFYAETAEQAEDLRITAERYREMSDLCQEIFWRQARSDMGGDTWAADQVGLRDGFTMVERPRQPSPNNILRMIRGDIQGLTGGIEFEG
jgi:hypothetical protein